MRSTVMVSIVACLAALVLSGCGNLKKDLEKAKSTIKELTAKNQSLNGELTKLKAEVAKLSQMAARLEEENQKLKSGAEALKKDLSKRSEEADQWKKERKKLREEVSKLKSENDKLTKELGSLKEQSKSPLLSATKLPAASNSTGVGQHSQKAELNLPRELAPCDAVIAYIRAAANIARDYKGDQRTKLMEDLKAKYDSKLGEAPSAAQKAAETYTKEIVKAWDGTDEDAIFRVLKYRNAVLKACDKTPKESGM
jgi:chromosome segregation ATPase